MAGGFLHPLYEVANADAAGLRSPTTGTRGFMEEPALPGPLCDRVRFSLDFWLLALGRFAGRKFRDGPALPRLEMITDAAGPSRYRRAARRGRAKPQGIGAIIWDAQTDETIVGTMPVPWDILRWLPFAALVVITITELLVVLVALVAFPRLTSGKAIRLWVDNTGAQWALIKGYSTNRWLAWLAVAIWLLLADRGSTIWVERVHSKDNLADWPSRFVLRPFRKRKWKAVSLAHAISESVFCDHT